VAVTVFEMLLMGEHGQGGHAEVVDLDREVVVVGDHTLPRVDAFERAGVNGCSDVAALEEAPPGMPRASASEAPLVVVPKATPAAEPVAVPHATPTAKPVVVPERVLEETPAARGAANEEHALVLRLGGRLLAGCCRHGAGPV